MDTPLLPVSVFDYFDYREYLRDTFQYWKTVRYGFSHRVFAREAGLSSPNYLLRVMNGQRKLSPKYAPQFVKGLKLVGAEIKYFDAIVLFTNAKDPDSMQDRKLNFYEKWYYPVVRELVTVFDFHDDYRLLARTCVPPITAAQAEGAVKFLTDNGFLEKDAQDRYQQVHPILTSGSEVRSVFVRKYHRKTLELSAEALDTIAPEERDVSSLTLSVSRQTYAEIKTEIQNFRKRLLALAENEKSPEVVCYCGFQLLPRSRQPEPSALED
jgi:hypothetical protein